MGHGKLPNSDLVDVVLTVMVAPRGGDEVVGASSRLADQKTGGAMSVTGVLAEDRIVFRRRTEVPQLAIARRQLGLHLGRYVAA